VPHCSSVRVSMRYRFSATVLTCILLLGGLGIANGVVAKSDHGHELDQGHHQQSYHRSPGWFNEDEEIAELAGTPSNHESLRGSRPVREGAYFVDNEELDAKSPGLGYRASPVVKDKIGGVYAAWGSKVMGVDNGDGWLKTSNGYLPYYVHGKAVVVKFATPEEAGIVTHQSGREWWGHVNYNEAAENGMRSWEELERQQGHLGRWCTAHNHLKQCSVAFVCKAGFCSECTISRDCNEKHACEWDASAGHRICIPRSLTRSWTWRETVCTELIVVTALLSAAAGMGGGGVYVPLLLLLLGFSTKEAIPLSQAMIVGGAVVNFIMFCGERHPEHKHRPRIDYDVVMMLNPGLAAGVTLGVMCNLVTPQWFIVVILIFTLVLALQKSLGKGIQQFKKESQQLAEKAAKGQSAAPAGSVKIRFADIPSFFVLAQENSRPLSLIGGCWLVFLACNFIRAPSCTTAYWFQRLSLVGICLFFTISGQTTIRSRLSSKGTSEGMMGWTERTRPPFQYSLAVPIDGDGRWLLGRLPRNWWWHHHGPAALGARHGCAGQSGDHGHVRLLVLVARGHPVHGLGEVHARVRTLVHGVGRGLHICRPDRHRLHLAAVAALILDRAFHRRHHCRQPLHDDGHRCEGHLR